HNEVFFPPTLPVQPTNVVDQIPKEDTVYLGTYEGKTVAFFTNKEKQRYYEAGVEKTSEYVGELVYESSGGLSPADYKKLVNPIRVYTKSNGSINSLGNFAQDPQKKYY